MDLEGKHSFLRGKLAGIVARPSSRTELATGQAGRQLKIKVRIFVKKSSDFVQKVPPIYKMNTINLKTKKQIYFEQQKKTARKKKEKDAPQIQAEIKAEQQPKPQNIQWSALEFIKHDKNPLWFITGGVIAAIFLIFAIWTKNFIFALIIVLAAFSIFIWTQKKPRKIVFSLTGKGLKIEDNFYAFDHLKSFWIFYEPPEIKYLSVESKKLFMPRIIIPIGEENPNKIREFLLKYLPEEKQHESLIDILARRLRY